RFRPPPSSTLFPYTTLFRSALGYLLNQNMLKPDDVVTAVEYDDDLAVAIVRTERATDYETKLKKKVQTSGCAQGTVFGDLMEVRSEEHTSELQSQSNLVCRL